MFSSCLCLPEYLDSTTVTPLLKSIILEDNVPRVQPTPASIDYEVAPQSNLLQYVDHSGYKTELGTEVEVSVSTTLDVCSRKFISVRSPQRVENLPST